jgi:hypothetical protein
VGVGAEAQVDGARADLGTLGDRFQGGSSASAYWTRTRSTGSWPGLGEQHAGVHWASIGWILPELHDPDGHEVRFYTIQHHTELDPGAVMVIDDPREDTERRERAAAQPR